MNAVPKLSKTQQALIDVLKSGVAVSYSPYAGRFNPKAYWHYTDFSSNYPQQKRVTAPAEALIEKGVAKKGKRDAHGRCDLVLVEVTP